MSLRNNISDRPKIRFGRTSAELSDRLGSEVSDKGKSSAEPNSRSFPKLKSKFFLLKSKFFEIFLLNQSKLVSIWLALPLLQVKI